MHKSSHRLLVVALTLLGTWLAFRGLIGCGGPQAEDDVSVSVPADRLPPAAELSTLRAQAERIRPLCTKLGKPQPGDWLDKHTEFGQTLDQFLVGHKKPVRDRFGTLYIQPLGDFTPTQDKLLKLTADFMQRFMGMPVKLQKPVALDDLPARARRVHPTWGGDQVLTTYLLDDVLKPRRPADAAGVLGLIATDLWPGEGWNFVFGQASLSERVGVWSLSRYGDPDAGEAEFANVLRRTLGTAVHETGHMLGIQHCTAYECQMNGSNHLEESDRRPLEFCAECQPKIWWTCRVDPLERCRKLAEFAEEHGLEDDATLWKKEVAALKDD